MTVLHDLVFGAPQSTEFINRTPRLKSDDATYTFFSHSSVRVTLPRPFNKRSQAANHVGWFTIPDYISSSGMCQIYLSGPQSCSTNGGAFYIHLALVKDLYPVREAPVIVRALQRPSEKV